MHTESDDRDKRQFIRITIFVYTTYMYVYVYVICNYKVYTQNTPIKIRTTSTYVEVQGQRFTHKNKPYSIPSTTFASGAERVRCGPVYTGRYLSVSTKAARAQSPANR